MNLSLDQKDITAAIEAHVVNQGIQVTGKNLVTTITCGRGPNGTSATVELVDTDTIAAGPEQNAKVPSGSGPAKAKAKPKQEQEPESAAFPVEEFQKENDVEDTEVTESVGGGLFDE